MQKKLILLAAGALLIAGAPCLQARDRGEGVRLATDIVNLVKAVVTPPPTVVVTTPAPAPVAVPVAVPAPAPAVPAFSYGYYNNVYVPTYNGWYYYGDVWCWGGRGPRPHHAPRWIPPKRHHHHSRHYRPAPPPRHHHHHHRGRR